MPQPSTARTPSLKAAHPARVPFFRALFPTWRQLLSDRYHFDPNHVAAGHCVRCGRELDDDPARCKACGLLDPEDPASRAWALVSEHGAGAFVGRFGGDLRDLLGDGR